MKVLGLIFIVLGVLACLTFVFLIPGLLMVAVGALLWIAGAVSGKRKAAAG